MEFTETDGVRFYEGQVDSPKMETLGPIEFQSRLWESAEAKNLSDVKRNLAHQAKTLGGNVIVEFAYGQKSVGFLKSMFSRDEVHWFGRGVVARIAEK